MYIFILNSALLGIGLAMDAFSVSLANGLNEPGMRKRRMAAIAGVYAWFQFMMPMAGWFCVRRLVAYFRIFEHWIPWIALILLFYIGGKMLWTGVRHRAGAEAEAEAAGGLSALTLLMQGIATSIDALSVGFTISKYDGSTAFSASVIIAAVTFAVCMAGLYLGKKIGTRLSDKASMLGGIILIAIGLEIFIRGI
ncbi:manganese efflux pump MntP family protein [Eubacterium pyruvativorans]|uniref:manganese efflux pump MntP n=1 Tax=Eubacterium pyruvativorans TaxID=155865 RepID=UPI0013D57DF7|nr:manganese efflux pump [Eubacterium pyruvativorans]